MKTKNIEAYSFAEFCQKAQEAFDEGFKFDFVSNENYPTAFGSFHTAIMVKAEVNESKDEPVDPDTEKEIDSALGIAEVVQETQSEQVEVAQKKTRKSRTSE